MADTPEHDSPPRTLAAFRTTGERLLKEGLALQAYDTLATGLVEFPTDVRLRQLLALALARSGASRSANEILEQLAGEGHTDEETLGLLARTYKDLWAESEDPQQRHRHLRRAFQCYRDAHRYSRGHWSGINAATMALLLGDETQARALAQTVLEHCLEIHRRAGPDDDMYWVLSTLGEAALLLGRWSEAEAYYAQAAGQGRRRLGDLVSTRRNARLILRHLEVDGARIEACFRVPGVAVFAGPPIDRPGQVKPRFPAAMEADVKRAILTWLLDAEIGSAYASAACGSDILFLESAREANAEIHIVLPYNREQFLDDSVDIVAGGNWVDRYFSLVDSAAHVSTASDQRMGRSTVSHEYGLMVLHGLAGLRADELDSDLRCLAVWDGTPDDRPGGTAAAVARWQATDRRVDIIDLAEIVHRRPAREMGLGDAAAPPAAQPSSSKEEFDVEIVGLMFADAKGFSKLTDEEIPRFVQHFLGGVAQVLAGAPFTPIVTNTWGDGLHFVFRSVREAGEVALRLCQAIRRFDWPACGLPPTLSLRIGLHAGPAYACVDPVTQRPNYLGGHVSRAARIEPITPPGEVYASAEFAALVRAEHIQDFICTYVGQTPLAKGYGTWPTYVVHHRRLIGD